MYTNNPLHWAPKSVTITYIGLFGSLGKVRSGETLNPKYLTLSPGNYGIHAVGACETPRLKTQAVLDVHPHLQTV